MTPVVIARVTIRRACHAATTALAITLLAALALGLASASPARAAEVVLPGRRAIVPEALVPQLANELAALGIEVVVVPRSSSFARAGSLVAYAKRGWGVAVRTPLARAHVEALRRHAAEGRCRVVVHAEGGLTFADLAALEQVGPCFFELHLAQPAPVLDERLKRLVPSSLVWEAHDVPGRTEVARWALLPQPVLAIPEDRATAAGSAVAPFDGRLAVSVRVEKGALAPATLALARDPRRRFPLHVVAEGGLDAAAARELRGLPRVSVELALERLERVPPGLLDAARALSRPVDPATERRGSEADEDAPLLRPPSF